jgi:hypothetical protein
VARPECAPPFSHPRAAFGTSVNLHARDCDEEQDEAAFSDVCCMTNEGRGRRSEIQIVYPELNKAATYLRDKDVADLQGTVLPVHKRRLVFP